MTSLASLKSADRPTRTASVESVGFVFTNFNNSRFTLEAVRSIAVLTGGDLSRVIIVDNKSEQPDVLELNRLQAEFPSLTVIYGDQNVGYFPGLNIGIRALRNRFPKVAYVVAGNNDLVFPPDFLERIAASSDVFGRWPVVSPDLISLDGEHQNPHVLAKISLLRELIWDLYYSSYWIARLIQKLAQVTRPVTARKDFRAHETAGPIYQGYGACYVLGPLFFESFKELYAPTFLMGEEFFLAKQLEQIGKQFYYQPSIVVHHHDHATTSKIPSRRLWQICREAHAEYRKHLPVWPWSPASIRPDYGLLRSTDEKPQ